MEWISVKDRLPDKYDKVVAYCEPFVGVQTFINKETFSMLFTHWMPLPSPPKQKDNE